MKTSSVTQITPIPQIKKADRGGELRFATFNPSLPNRFRQPNMDVALRNTPSPQKQTDHEDPVDPVDQRSIETQKSAFSLPRSIK